MTLDHLVQAVRDGQSRVLVLRGEPGVGKTALLQHVLERSSGCRVARAVGVQSEMELPFAALHQLCATMLDRLERLPEPQRDALGTAFGLSGGGPPERFLVGLAVLSLFSDAAEERPLVCLIDDAQWLDQASAQTLAFVARRLFAESVAMVFATRERHEKLAGLPDMVVEGLPAADARELLRSVVPGPIDEQILDRIVAETAGNPLALLELPRGLTRANLTAASRLPDAFGLPGRIEESFQRRLATLPPDTQRLMLVAAAEPVGESMRVWRAAGRLGIGPDAATSAAEANLVEIGRRVRFRHPLVRSAVYLGASADELREVHAALADVTDPETDPDRRAWHRAQAARGPDEEVAAELERSAGRAQARGGLAAASALLEKATRLTPDRAHRVERALAAAQAKLGAGEPDAAVQLLASLEVEPLNPLQRGRLDLLRAEIEFASSRGSDAPPLLLEAAKALAPLDPELARETYLEAISAALFAGRLGRGGGPRMAAQAARSAPAPRQPASPADLLLDGLALRLTEGRSAGQAALKQALRGFCSDAQQRCWPWLSCVAAADLWDDESWHVLSSHNVEVGRRTGALNDLPLALHSRCFVDLFGGDLATATSLVEEAHAATEATGSKGAPYGALALAAWQGTEARATELIETTLADVVSRGEGIGVTVALWARAVLNNALGRHEIALAAAEEASAHANELGPSAWALFELVEAGVRTGNTGQAVDALHRLTESTRASGTDWAMGIEARCRALLSEGEDAEALYREAVERLGRTRIRTGLARAHLLFGEWLRGEGRQAEACEELRIAHEMCTTMGIEAFADRARRELVAAGGTVQSRPAETASELTRQEAQIARLAREGLSNPEIGGRLFISPRTVEYHLSKVFTKLGINSRTQLKSVLSREPRAAAAV